MNHTTLTKSQSSKFQPAVSLSGLQCETKRLTQADSDFTTTHASAKLALSPRTASTWLAALANSLRSLSAIEAAKQHANNQIPSLRASMTTVCEAPAAQPARGAAAPAAAAAPSAPRNPHPPPPYATPEALDAHIDRAWAHFRALGAPRLHVAPMVDASELPFRMLCRAHGATAAYTPMLHSRLFVENKGYRAEHFTTCAEDRPLFAQFCANDPEMLVRAALLVQVRLDGPRAVDVRIQPSVASLRQSILQPSQRVLTAAVAVVYLSVYA
jgi:hypothetical protein